ncbi:peptidoglycan/LPS O-acetylase OafA/YrhL [Flavobacterium sp. 103]|uniref:acyltransferase family protein n=1 Tax=Flavobacterium sp. 103 TaxID=2135624 RepID=UPI000D5C42AD|nr:acyltransferase [Flavobacterium sp. 103]PVX46933.1 peptidoglycan/LPS O-acetylase OafA/YrhL [Flavobacterium sp. 103]
MPKTSDTIRFYRPELDALRFFAFMCVFFFHFMDYVPVDQKTQPIFYTFCTAGAFGVPIFFLLSSFLIVELLLRELKKTDTIHIKSFYTRRILRIWPLYFAVFIGLIILGQFIPGVATNKVYAWLAFLFFYGNWYIFHFGWIGGPIDPLWSIAVEEQFYIAIPLLTKMGGRKLLTKVSIALLIVSYALCVYYAKLQYSGESGQWLNSFFQFQFFAAGALLAIFLKGRIPKWTISIRFILFIIALFCWFFAVYGFGVKSYDGHPTVSGAILGWLLVLGGSTLFFLTTLGTPQKFIPKSLVYLGRISFGLYMFHSLVFHLVFNNFKTYWEKPLLHWKFSSMTISVIGTILVFVFTVGMASLSYRYFERPFLKLKERFAIINSRPE